MSKTGRTIRIAKPEDAEQIRKIYRPYCQDTTISFEQKVPSLSEVKSRIQSISVQFPYLVLLEGDQILGYAYATQHRERAAYRWSVESSVYVNSEFNGQAVGSTLYTTLFEILKRQRYVNVYAGITMPNDASVAIHKKFGFNLVGTYKNVGYKHGLWHDVSWWHLQLSEPQIDPEEPLSVTNIPLDLSI